MEQEKNKNKILLAISILLLIVIVIGVSYAAFSFAQVGSKENVIKTGTITMTYNEGKNNISINNAMPMEDSVGKILSDVDQLFDFTISINIKGQHNIDYEVTAVKDENSTLGNNDVRIYLEKSSDATNYSAVNNPSGYIPLGAKDEFGANAKEMRLDIGNTTSTVTYYYKLRMWVSKDYEVTNESKFFTIQIKVYGSDNASVENKPEATSGATELIKKANSKEVTNYSDGDTAQMYTFEQPETEQFSALVPTSLAEKNSIIKKMDTDFEQPPTEQFQGDLIDYRYIGNNPANYIEFNDEIWRIIGVFDARRLSSGKYEKRIKIMRDTGIGEIAIAANDDRTYWTESNDDIKDWSNSTLNFWLTTDYQNRVGDYSTTGLTVEAKKMVDTTEWYLGRPPDNLTNGLQSLGAVDYYRYERSLNVYSNHTHIVAEVGLMYASDYAYTFGKNVSNGVCYSQTYACSEEEAKLSWIYNSNNTIASNNSSPINSWTISSISNQSNELYRPIIIGSNGGAYPFSPQDSANVRPVIYLSNKVKITSGDGTKNNPYKLSL